MFIDKHYRGIRIGMRVGAISLDEAEKRLQARMQDIDVELARRTHPRPTFADCAARYLVQSREKRSLQAIEVHLRALLPHIGHLEPHQVHDETLRPFVSQRIASCVTAITINRSLEVVRTILTRAARSYRDEDGRPWLEMLPPLITMLPESPRPAYPITWDEQDRLFPKLPPHLQRMALFAVNTGLRDSNVCGLEWAWEVPVPEIGRSVFVIPSDSYKANRHHVVILNDAAWSIVQAQRGLHPTWVFPYRGRRINTMNNTAWQKVRREAGLRYVRTGLDLPVDVALFLPGAAPPLRVDTAYAEEGRITPFHDSTVMKVIAHNASYVRSVFAHPAFKAGELHKGFLGQFHADLIA